MPALNELSAQFAAYCEKLSGEANPPDRPRDDLGKEVVERLAQLAFLEAELMRLDEAFGTVAMVAITNENGEVEHYNATFERDQQLRFGMRLGAEAFYYFAFRIRKILRNAEFPFPGFAKFEASGVRDVRNHLIEHPEGGASRVMNQTWSWTPETGIALKTGRQEWEPKSFIDKGFRANVVEFTNAFANCLAQVAPQSIE
jgi:hypothetical protein